MQGSLFPSDKRTSEKSPDWSGSIMVEGKEYWLSGWTKTGTRGEFYSLAVKPKEDRPASPQRQEPARQEPARREPPRAAARPAPVEPTFTSGIDDEVPF
jgi:hypothetical protein